MTKTVVVKPKVRAKQSNIIHLHRDRGYRFTDRDPILEEITDLISKSGLSCNAISDITSKHSGGVYRVAASTMDNWLSGKTRRPQNLTVTWVGFALGYERRWVKTRN